MIKYIGSKRALVDWIGDAIDALPEVRTVCDLFSGTARVGRELKARGYAVHANDVNSFAATLARGLVEADAGPLEASIRGQLAELNALPARPGWFTADYAERARYLRPENAARVEAIRGRIAELSLEPTLEAVLLTSLLLAADRVDSTVGVQMAFLKAWAPRAQRDLALEPPPLIPAAAAGPARVTQACALELAPSVDADCVYLDPPYNQHSYLGNYHVWETLVRWDRPATYGVANKRVDCRTRTSPFNRKREALAAFEQLVERLDVRHLVVSFSDEGFLAREDLERILGRGREVAVLGREHDRYIGARIGIHNPRGRRVGKVGRLRNTEYLFVASREALPEGLRGGARAASTPS
ncbi:MAG: DNA adenine methylase [Planctomycetota bacterium]